MDSGEASNARYLSPFPAHISLDVPVSSHHFDASGGNRHRPTGARLPIPQLAIKV